MHDSSFKRTFSVDDSVYIRRTQEDTIDEIIDNFKTDAGLEVTEEGYQLDGAFWYRRPGSKPILGVV